MPAVPVYCRRRTSRRQSVPQLPPASSVHSGIDSATPPINTKPPHLALHTAYLHYLVYIYVQKIKNLHAQEVIETNCRVRLSHPKNGFKIFVW